MANNFQSSGAQYRPMVPSQQGQQFIPAASQHFHPVGQGVSSSNVGMPPVQTQQLQFSQPMQQLPPRPSQLVHGTPLSQPVPVPYGSQQPHQPGPALSSYMPGVGAPGVPVMSSYNFVPPYGQPQNTVSMSSQYQPISQMHAPVAPAAGQPWLSAGSQSAAAAIPVQHAMQPPATSSSDPAVNVPSLSQPSLSDWQEHTSADGRRYYYNKRTRQSSWEKPLELMTPIERADASTVWKEFTTPEGRKYYYNKVTKQSKWSIPEELKLAREQAQSAASQGIQSEVGVTSHAEAAVTVTSSEKPNASNSLSFSISSTFSAVASSPIPVSPIVAIPNPPPAVVSGSPTTNVAQPAVTSAAGGPPPELSVTPSPIAVAGSTGVSDALVDARTTATTKVSGFDNLVSQDAANSVDGASMQDIEEAKKGMAVAGKINVTPSEEKTVDDEPLVYANKQEAKNAFKALLESANVQSDWTWEQAMREIINDKKYGALKTLGERKQAFNEYLGQRKKLEAEERRLRQKKAREEFTKMLEESKELTSSIKWSKAVTMFENDERFKAVERGRDREDLYDNYIVELERKEKEKAAEENRRNIAEFRKFLEACDFIKVNSQWRKIQDRLEDDERCLRLEKIDRLLIFQDYIRDLEKEEEELKKLQKEQLRRTERKNRDEFRKLMEEHVDAGILTAKTHWRDYCLKVKDLPQYHDVASNTSGSLPKELFEDIAEELEKQYHEDKTRIKDAMKLKKISVVSTWTFDDFKAAVFEDVGSSLISDINLKIVYEELLERAMEKEEKEAKKRQRLADDFTKLLYTFKEITASSDWEDCKPFFEESQEYRSIGEESFRKEIFEDYIELLQEKAKEKERKREEEKAKKEKEREDKERRKEKERKEKEREREKEKGKDRMKKDEADGENVDVIDSYGHKEDKRKEKEKEKEKEKDKEKDRKHRKRHQSDDVSSDKDEKEESKKSRRHGSDRKKSRKHAYSPESDSESRHRRHKRDHRDGSRRNGGHEELEDGELGEDVCYRKFRAM
ncbi:WW domain-containing protein/FF domain-containing protein [Cephalotus follicularis]|uniref:WW domain-containing protein/FF domain-containing protein n=1 Tax=Cephalotus follicularis TaxID=3775 RepID=A0A1Q3ALQ1_CEPFO|nr:WW domain-containing protein/FF domain-containing protein [Cephalotus follicularis]